MNSRLSIELKFRLRDVAACADLLSKAQCLRSNRDIDVYYDTRQNHALLLQGHFIRVRNSRVLEFKLNPVDVHTHDRCIEEEFPLPLSESDVPRLECVCAQTKVLSVPSSRCTFELFRTHNNLYDFVTIDKTRAKYLLGAYTLSLDTIEDLGTFLEIEYDTPNKQDSSTPAILKEMHRLVEGMSLQEVNVGYVELMLLQHNPELYSLGRFKL